MYDVIVRMCGESFPWGITVDALRLPSSHPADQRGGRFVRHFDAAVRRQRHRRQGSGHRGTYSPVFVYGPVCIPDYCVWSINDGSAGRSGGSTKRVVPRTPASVHVRADPRRGSSFLDDVSGEDGYEQGAVGGGLNATTTLSRIGGGRRSERSRWWVAL